LDIYVKLPHKVFVPESLDGNQYFQYLLRRWRFIVSVCAIAVVLALVVSLVLPKNYTATASLLIEPPAGNDPRTSIAVSPVYLESLRSYEVLAKVVVVGASAVDSTRILLNSKSPAHPNGIGNSSDVIGRYLCEQIRVHVAGYIPALYGKEIVHDYGAGGEHMYLPRFTHRLQNPGYLRGFGMQFWNSGCQPGNLPKIGTDVEGFGAGFKREVKKRYPAWVELHPFGETLPYARNRITVDATSVDKYGVPRLKIDYEIGDNERKMRDHIYDVLEEAGKRAGIEWVHFTRGELDSNGSAIHEHGCCRMGEDPKRSALNKFNQMHDVKNVFVVDGSAFTSASEKNPTLTILALSWRATDYLAEQIKSGNL